jgi:hypothetical protein
MAIVELEDDMVSVPITLGRKRGTPTVQHAIAMGAPTLIHGIRAMCEQLHISPEEWNAAARRRAAGGDALSETSLGKKGIEREVDGERAIGGSTGFRNV